MDRDRNMVTITCKGFINRVIHDFIDKMMKRFYVGAANVHPWSPADSFEPFEDLDITCIVVFGFIVQFLLQRSMPG